MTCGGTGSFWISGVQVPRSAAPRRDSSDFAPTGCDGLCAESPTWNAAERDATPEIRALADEARPRANESSGCCRTLVCFVAVISLKLGIWIIGLPPDASPCSSSDLVDSLAARCRAASDASPSSDAVEGARGGVGLGGACDAAGSCQAHHLMNLEVPLKSGCPKDVVRDAAWKASPSSCHRRLASARTRRGTQRCQRPGRASPRSSRSS